jgi:hypothetical protein
METGWTAHVERVDGTLRHCLKRLTRKTIAFSKSERALNDVLAIFFHHYNLSKPSVQTTTQSVYASFGNNRSVCLTLLLKSTGIGVQIYTWKASNW